MYTENTCIVGDSAPSYFTPFITEICSDKVLHHFTRND